MSTFRLLVSRRWWWKSLIILAGCAFLIGLGVWQLNRLEERRLYNERLLTQRQAAPIDLNQHGLPVDGELAQFRRAEARGTFDYDRQVSIKNQYLDGQLGVALVTPLLLDDRETAVLVNRGWIPHQIADPDNWSNYREGDEGVLEGYLQPSRTLPNGRQSARPDDPKTGWFRLDVEAISNELPYPVLPMVLQLAPDGSGTADGLPRRFQQDLTIGEGNHLSYAIQWFIFALIGGIVYIAVVRREEAILLGEQRPEPPIPAPPVPADSQQANSI